MRAHAYPSQGVAIGAIGASTRDKSFVTAGVDGSLVLRHMTSERSLISFPATGQKVDTVLLTPKMDGIIAKQEDGRLARYDISSPHPEVSWKALFGKVWYEGYGTPEYVWQSHRRHRRLRDEVQPGPPHLRDHQGHGSTPCSSPSPSP